MKEAVKSKLVKIYSKGQITIPVEFRRRLGINADTILQLVLKEGKIEVIPLQLVEERGALLREYSNEEIKRFLEEDKIDAEMAAKVRRLLSRV